MGCKIIFSPQAIADLEAAVRFIAEENPDAALRIGNVLIDRVAILENFPLLGSPYPKRPGVRKLVSRPYIIFYRFREQDNFVDILRYWHGAQREPDLRSLD
jgi:toxin ParE1/3/4